jgi:hypothetical protein
VPAALRSSCESAHPPRKPNPTHPTPQEKLPTCPHVDDGSYRVSSSGFRLVHGDVCTGIDQIISDTDGQGAPRGGGGGPPSRHRGGGRGHGFFTFLMVAAAFTGVGAAWYHFLASPAQRAAAGEAGGAAAAFCSGLVALAADAADTALAKLGAGFGGLRFGGGGGSSAAYEPLDEEVGAGLGGPLSFQARWGMFLQEASGPTARRGLTSAHVAQLLRPPCLGGSLAAPRPRAAPASRCPGPMQPLAPLLPPPPGS